MGRGLAKKQAEDLDMSVASECQNLKYLAGSLLIRVGHSLKIINEDVMSSPDTDVAP